MNGIYHIILHQSHQQAFLSKQFLSKIPAEFQYVRRNVFMEEVNTENLWTFEVGTKEGINIPIWNIVGFQQKKRHDSQNLSKDRDFIDLQ